MIAQSNDPIPTLAQSQEWLRILHYKSHLFRGFRSAVDGADFFIAANGAKDPEAEMRATILAFQKRIPAWGKRKQPVACAFPARFKFLNTRLKLGLTSPPCSLFDDFVHRYDPAGATLVFSAAYPNNPASMFGHTLLRIKRKSSSDDLLDNSLSYAANVPPDENDFAFLWFGVTGGYPGQFSMIPYYAKVNEYSNSENRDLWEYELDLNSEQTWWVLASAWEIETNSYLDYFFFDENCSWLILRLLEVARPDWNLADFSLDVIPGETVKRLTRTPGAVRSVRFRPSLFKKMRQAVESLSSEDLQNYREILSEKVDPLTIKNPVVLEAVLTRLHYEKQKNAEDFLQSQLMRKTLLARAKLEKTTERTLLPIPETTRVDLGHDSARVGFATNLKRFDFHWKSAYHDLYSPDLGFAAFSELNFPGITLSYNRKAKEFFVSQIEGVSIVSLQAITEAVTPISWKARLAYDRVKDLCESCRAGRADGALGLSLISRNEKNAAWLLTGARAEASRHFEKNIRTLGLAEFGAGRAWGHNHKTILISRYMPFLFGMKPTKFLYDLELTHTLRISSFWELRGSLEKSRNFNEAKIQLNRYF